MDDEALARTLTGGRGTYWSRSRQEYWLKGETSGNVQWVKEVRLDCDGDTLLRQGRPGGRGLPHRRPHLLRRGRAARWLTRARPRRPGRATSDRSSCSASLAAGALATAGTQPWFAFDTDDEAYTCEGPVRRVLLRGRGHRVGRERARPRGARVLGRGARDAGTLPPSRLLRGAPGRRGRHRRRRVRLPERAGRPPRARRAERQRGPGRRLPPGGSGSGGRLGRSGCSPGSPPSASSGTGPRWGAATTTPTDGGRAVAPPDDLWKAMDQGHDPTS